MNAKEGKVISISGKYNAAEEKSENVVGSRIAEARKQRGMNLALLAEMLQEHGVDISKWAVAKWETGETVPNVYQFFAVCSALGLDESFASFKKNYVPDLNEEGLRKVAEYRKDLVATGNYKPTPKAYSYIRYIEMPIALMPAAAGTGNRLDDQEFYEMVSFPEDAVPENADVGIKVSGDSMEPVYHDGQVVWVQKCDTLSLGDVGIFIYEGNAFIKVFGEQEPDEALLDEFTDHYGTTHKQAILISYNSEKYDPIEISPYIPFKIFGRVLK